MSAGSRIVAQQRRQVVCRSCVNYEGPDNIEQSIRAAREQKTHLDGRSGRVVCTANSSGSRSSGSNGGTAAIRRLSKSPPPPVSPRLPPPQLTPQLSPPHSPLNRPHPSQLQHQPYHQSRYQPHHQQNHQPRHQQQLPPQLHPQLQLQLHPSPHAQTHHSPQHSHQPQQPPQPLKQQQQLQQQPQLQQHPQQQLQQYPQQQLQQHPQQQLQQHPQQQLQQHPQQQLQQHPQQQPQQHPQQQLLQQPTQPQLTSLLHHRLQLQPIHSQLHHQQQLKHYQPPHHQRHPRQHHQQQKQKPQEQPQEQQPRPVFSPITPPLEPAVATCGSATDADNSLEPLNLSAGANALRPSTATMPPLAMPGMYPLHHAEIQSTEMPQQQPTSMQKQLLQRLRKLEIKRRQMLMPASHSNDAFIDNHQRRSTMEQHPSGIDQLIDQDVDVTAKHNNDNNNNDTNDNDCKININKRQYTLIELDDDDGHLNAAAADGNGKEKQKVGGSSAGSARASRNAALVMRNKQQGNKRSKRAAQAADAPSASALVTRYQARRPVANDSRGEPPTTSPSSKTPNGGEVGEAGGGVSERDELDRLVGLLADAALGSWLSAEALRSHCPLFKPRDAQSLRCARCKFVLDETHFVQCPAQKAHKFCFLCAMTCIRRQMGGRLGAAGSAPQLTSSVTELTKSSFAEIASNGGPETNNTNKPAEIGATQLFCPSGSRCRLPSSGLPWTFLATEVSYIFAGAKAQLAKLEEWARDFEAKQHRLAPAGSGSANSVAGSESGGGAAKDQTGGCVAAPANQC